MKINPIGFFKSLGKLPFDLMNIKFDGKMDNQKRKVAANSIVRNHVIWSMGTGAIPIPVVDFFAVSAVQLDMVRQLSKLYELDFKETEGKALVTSLTGSGLASMGARSAAKLIPGIGTIVGSVTMSILSGATTYALGEVFKEHFDTGGTFLDFDPGRLKKYYQEKFEKGKKVAQDLKAEQERAKKEGKTGNFTVKTNAKAAAEEPVAEMPQEEGKTPIVETKKATTEKDENRFKGQDAILAKIKELAELKEIGILSDEEFQQMKTKILEKF